MLCNIIDTETIFLCNKFYETIKIKIYNYL